uniref:YceI like family protein n=1 Tax=uncultured Flavobacteriia bacterium TaxID=212695 RepID=H6RE64_9BACT|nr:rhodanese-like domain protein [uncultured bacterium]CCF99325.1 YceI like family protein [uncultured Flavobacteriia bacterium]
MNERETILIDTQNSKVSWEGFKPSGEHNGLISIAQGTISLEKGNLVGGNFKFDVNSITDLDMPADDEYNKKFFDNLKDKFINDEFELSFELNTIQ